MIDHLTVERIIAAADIVDVVSGYVNLRRTGSSYKGLCPFHDDKTPSFSVSPARQVCKCFSCGKGGNAVHFIMEMEQLSYPEALKFLAKKYGIEVKEKEYTAEEKEQQNVRESMFAVNEWASQYFHDTMLTHPDGKAVGLAYFRNRGFRDDIIEKFRLGFSLAQKNSFLLAARQKGYKEEYLVKTGLCYRKEDGALQERFYGRAMFPWFSVSGKISAFGGRVLDSRTKGVAQKYVNSPDSEVYHKGKELYGIYQAKKAIAREDRVYMVEGYTDVISMHQCGIENVVANSGTALTVDQIRILHRFTSNVTLLYDGDDAGIHAAIRGTDMFLEEGMNVKVLLLPDGDDPDSFARKHNATEYKAFIEEHQTDFITFKTGVLMKDAGKDPIKRAQLIKDLIQSIAVIPEEITRTVYVHECSAMLGVEERVLLHELNKRRKALYEQRVKDREQAEARKQRLQAGQEVASPSNGQTAIPPSNVSDTEQVSASENAAKGSPATATDISRDNVQCSTTKDTGQPSLQPPSQTSAATGYNCFTELERQIVKLLVRYGEMPIQGTDNAGNPLTCNITQYVAQELSEDGLEFQTPVFKRMLEMASAHAGQPDFQARSFFISLPDADISRIAADMVSEPYHLSNMFIDPSAPNESDRLTELISHYIFDYKLAVVEAEMRRLQERMKDPVVMSDTDTCTELLEKTMFLKTIQQKLSQRLGDRVIRKISR